MKEKYSTEEVRSIKIGFYVSVIIALIAGFYIHGRNDVEHIDNDKYYQIYARYGRTDGLQIGDKVRMAGIDIGKIVDAKLDDHYKAILTLEVKSATKIPDDSSASIVSDSIMGNKYIEIEPGGSEDVIPRGGEFSYTQDAMVLEELLDRIISIGKAKKEKNNE